MRKPLFQLVLVLALTVAASVAAAAERQATVVELYTSEGCSSCPPADAYLGDLAKRDDLIALSYHVDYWDYIGWKDTYALPINSTRQRDYARYLGMGYVYTPQMVVQGMAHTTGSNRTAVEGLIQNVQGAKRLPVSLTPVAGGIRIDIPGGTFDEQARILVAAYDNQDETNIRRGENAGRKIAYYNVVRVLKPVGTWDGKPVSLTVTAEDIDTTGRNGCAVLVQSTKNGRILGAAKLSLGPQG